MKLSLRLLSLLSASLLLAAGLLDAATPTPMPGKGRLTDRIDALLRPRLQPAALPLVLPNPFTVVRGSAEREDPATTSATSASTIATNVDSTPLTDTELLERAISRLRIGGIVEVGGITKIILNATPYREGEGLTFEDKGKTLYLQVLRLTPTDLTLGYNDASQVVRLKTPARPR